MGLKIDGPWPPNKHTWKDSVKRFVLPCLCLCTHSSGPRALVKKNWALAGQELKGSPCQKHPKRQEVEKRAFFFRLHFADIWSFCWSASHVTRSFESKKSGCRKSRAREYQTIFFLSLPDQAQVSNSYPSKNWPRWMFLIGLKMCLVVRAFALNSHFAHAWIIIILVELKRSVSKK